MIAAFSYSIWVLQSSATGPSPADCASAVNDDPQMRHATSASNTSYRLFSWASDASQVHSTQLANVASRVTENLAAAASQVNP